MGERKEEGNRERIEGRWCSLSLLSILGRETSKIGDVYSSSLNPSFSQSSSGKYTVPVERILLHGSPSSLFTNPWSV